MKRANSVTWTDIWFFVFLHLHFTNETKLYIAFIPYILQIIFAMIVVVLNDYGVISKVKIWFLKRKLNEIKRSR